MAAAALMGLPPHCSHSITLFVNVVKTNVLATFLVISEARSCGPYQRARTPLVQALFGEFAKKNVAVAAAGRSPHARRCSHSNFIFANPVKTTEIFVFFVSKSRFAYKKMEINISASDLRCSSFDICSKELSNMRNRFFTLPKPEKLNYKEFLRF